MKYNIRLEHMEISEFDQDQLEKKLARLEKHLTPPFVTDVTISHNARRLHGNVVECRINIQQGKKVFHADRNGDDVQTVIDDCIGALKNELQKYYEKQKAH
ncbi:MAG: ribosome-associated translation inhibitor RaiA [Candidatus Andersenbacteria bacterium]